MIGCLFALCKDKILEYLNRFKALGNVWIVTGLLILVSSKILTGLNIEYKLHLGFLFIPLGIGSSSGTLTNLLIGVLMLISITRVNLWYNFLNTPAMEFVGKLSYSLYLWQQLFFSTSVGWMSGFPFNFVFIICTALISYYLIEKPVLKLKKKFELRKLASIAEKKESAEPSFAAI